jgi:hypothetical protein
MAWKRRPLWAGALAGVAFAASPKGLFVLAVCISWDASLLLLAGFAAVTVLASGWMWSAGALAGYWGEVWRWGRVYAGATFLENPVRTGVQRTLSWAGFHAALVIGAILSWRDRGAKWIPWVSWLGFSLLGAAAGLRFFPRYYFQILPVTVLLAARGFARLPRKYAAALALLLVVPFARFAPNYVAAATSATWRDTAMDRDSRAVAAILQAHAHPGDTLFVWGFRPEIYVYSHLPAASRYLDSQPLTGVPADRHLTQSAPLETQESRAHRADLTRTHPDFIVDGLGLYNPHLAPANFDDLRPWLANYRELARSGQSAVYERIR